MKKVIVKKSKLTGEVRVSGAKNSSLRLLAATLLTDKNVVLTEVPTGILDFQIHAEMLEVLGKKVIMKNNIAIVSEDALDNSLEWNQRSIRNTLLILGALLTRTGFGKVPLPGGCKLGERKYDLHIMAMEQMGAKVWEEEGYLLARSEDRLIGTEIRLPFRSTGATENSILMATLAKGQTRIWNPHIRPEILDLINMLNHMGANITVNGQESIIIEGVEYLSGVEYACVPDNMEALTFAIAAAVTGGEVEIHNFPLEHLEVPMIYLRESGLKYYVSEDRRSIIVKKSDVYPIEIATGPYPSLNSDMQPLFAVYGLLAKGESKIVDLRFSGRYQYALELNKMGANTKVDGDMLIIRGGKHLIGTTVKALDLRAGAALILAGMVAEGETIIEDFEQVERGYEHIIEKIKRLSGDIDVLD